MKDIENESKSINYGLFEKCFKYSAPTVLAKELFETKDKKKNNNLVKLIQVKQSILKDKINNMSGEEIKIEKPDKILGIVEKIIKFNVKIQKQPG